MGKLFSKFGLYFRQLKSKIKEMALDIIYRLYTSIEEVLLKKFYVEFEFYTQAGESLHEYNKKHKTNYLGDFKCLLPVIFMVKHSSEAEFLVNEFKKQLELEYKLSIIGISTLEEISEISLQHKVDTIESKFKGAKLGKIEFWTFTPKKGIAPVDYNEPRKDEKFFRYVKSGPNLILQNWDFVIHYYKTTNEE